MQIFVKMLLRLFTRHDATYHRRPIGAMAGAGVQIFVKTLLRLLLTSRRDVSTPRKRDQGPRRCLSRHCCAHVPHAATQRINSARAGAGMQIFVKTLLGLLLASRRDVMNRLQGSKSSSRHQ